MRMELTTARKVEMNQIQYIVNTDTVYTTDKEHYHVEEYWEAVGPGNHKGDCEDYALGKMKMLRERGWPKETLDIGVCLFQGQGHAVLIAHTSEGDYVLDNNHKYPLLWDDLTEYKWVEVSVDGDFNNWHKVG